MQPLPVDARVRLEQDVPELELRRGEVGTVCSAWCAPAEVYQVEFSPTGSRCRVRTLLRIEQIESEER